MEVVRGARACLKEQLIHLGVCSMRLGGTGGGRATGLMDGRKLLVILLTFDSESPPPEGSVP